MWEKCRYSLKAFGICLWRQSSINWILNKFWYSKKRRKSRNIEIIIEVDENRIKYISKVVYLVILRKVCFILNAFYKSVDRGYRIEMKN